jgi:N utilization substance protein A
VVVVSRADPKFLAKLFEMEIPEIYDGIIEIKRIAREPGERAKVAVESHDDRIDAVGACVGMKGVRIHTIVRELNNENIDVINFSEQAETFIARALAPAKLKSIELNREAHTANVLVAADQVSLAIGRNGQNIRLASKLTGFELNLLKEGGEDEYDIDLDEFEDELGAELIGQMAAVGLKSARDVLEATMDKMLSVSGMTQDRVEEVREILRKELEEAEVEDESGEAEEEEEEEEEQVEEAGPPAAAASEAPVPPGDDTPVQSPTGEQPGSETHGEDAGHEGR